MRNFMYKRKESVKLLNVREIRSGVVLKDTLFYQPLRQKSKLYGAVECTT